MEGHHPPSDTPPGREHHCRFDRELPRAVEGCSAKGCESRQLGRLSPSSCVLVEMDRLILANISTSESPIHGADDHECRILFSMPEVSYNPSMPFCGASGLSCPFRLAQIERKNVSDRIRCCLAHLASQNSAKHTTYHSLGMLPRILSVISLVPRQPPRNSYLPKLFQWSRVLERENLACLQKCVGVLIERSYTVSR